MKKTFIWILIVLMLSVLFGCVNDEKIPQSDNKPENLEGTFVNEELGTLIFNGDGETLQFDLTQQGMEDLGLSAEKGEGNYAFTFGNKGLCDYDKADVLSITFNGVTTRLNNVFAGETATDSNRIVLELYDPSKTIVFTKQ